jgi:hypothetical protein
MRVYYLRSKSSDGCCRGGVGSGDKDRDSGFEVEIGGQCHCSSHMMSFMAHYDEIMSYLQLVRDEEPLAAMLLGSLLDTWKKIEKEVADSYAAAEQASCKSMEAAIPAGVYWSPALSGFYTYDQHQYMGTAFREQWYGRRELFPVLATEEEVL